MTNTKKYYEDNAKEFFDSTVETNVDKLYSKFLKYIPKQGRILDLGCGSGRDSKFFLDSGYKVVALDSSEKLCEMAKEKLGVETVCISYFDMDFQEEFEGIWACASLLHCNKNELLAVMKKIKSALKSGGILYASFKYGDFCGERDGRFFLDLNEKSVRNLLSQINGIEIIELWKSEDVRRERDVQWLNIIVKK